MSAITRVRFHLLGQVRTIGMPRTRARTRSCLLEAPTHGSRHEASSPQASNIMPLARQNENFATWGSNEKAWAWAWPLG